nr:MAG TPA: hypothetical protein [Caudoviricetes sp.]
MNMINFDRNGKGLRTLAVAILIGVAIYYHAHGWIIGWLIFMLFVAITED